MGLERRVSYIATARTYGREMASRIEKHRTRRPADWTTIEAPLDLKAAVAAVGAETNAVMVECLYVWASNRLLGLGDSAADDWAARVEALEKELVAETRALMKTGRDAAWDLVLVTSEVGLGSVPEKRRPRAFRDLLGRVNRTAADDADEVYLVAVGLPLALKGPATARGPVVLPSGGR